MAHDSEQQALLRAIIDKPDEDTVRLAYADWLDEHDQHELAEFIRVQVKLATAPTEETDGLKEHAITKAEQFGREWLSEYHSRGLSGVEVRRGFVEEVHATATAFIRQGQRWCAAAPFGW